MKLTKKNLAYFAHDTSVAIAYYTTFMGLAERYVAGMEPEEVYLSRLINAGITLVAARPYTWFRRQVSKALHVNEESKSYQKIGVETLTSLLFYTPLYVGSLLGVDVDPQELETGIYIMTGMVATSFVYGKVLDASRNFFGLEGLLDKNIK